MSIHLARGAQLKNPQDRASSINMEMWENILNQNAKIQDNMLRMICSCGLKKYKNNAL